MPLPPAGSPPIAPVRVDRARGGWAQQFSSSAFHGNFSSALLVPTSFYPANGTFAKHYQEDWFVIDAGFSDVLDNNTVNSGTFWLSEKSGANVSAKVVAASKMAILSPDSQLKPDTDYVAHLSHGIKSKDGRQLYADIQWGFTTRNVTISNILPINTLLNISLATAITPIVHLNLTVPPLLPLDNSSAANQSVQPPPEAIQNQSQGQEPQGQPGNQPQGTGGQPVVPPAPGAQDNSQQGGQGQNNSPPSNVSGQQPPAQPAPNVTGPAPNATQPPANASMPGHAAPQQQPQAPGGTGILDGIINFFKSLFGMK